MTSPDPLMTPAQKAINRRIRRLMSQPESHRRGEEYARLLILWNQAGKPKAHRGASAAGTPRRTTHPATIYMDFGHETALVGLSA